MEPSPAAKPGRKDHTMVINVAAFAAEEVKNELVYLAGVRAETLRRCYAMPGYKELPLEDKNNVYDKTKAEVMEEL